MLQEHVDGRLENGFVLRLDSVEWHPKNHSQGKTPIVMSPFYYFSGTGQDFSIE